MAGVLVDVLLERLATLALDKFVQEMKLVGEVEQEIEDLIRKLRAIQAVLEDAEQRQVTEASVKLWLDELKDVSFDMDDVIDEWITRVEKHLLEKQEKQQKKVEKHQLEKQEKQQKKVCFPFPSSCFRFGQVDYKLFLRREIAVKVKELNERLKKIEENKQSFNFQQNTPRSVPELLQRPKTTSLPNAETFGRDSEKNLLISKLLSESSEEIKVPLIIPVVGLGGMGKTYLANLVYNEIKTKFDKSIWVCVSHPFDEIKIAQAIIEELDKDNSSKSSNVLQTLTQCIFDLIKGKKYLLVLDDVWYPKSSQWEEFIKPLSKGAAGSKVLVTTRNEDVATDVMNATTELVTLKGLGEASCLSLFYHSAGMVESSVSKEFHDIGLEIVKRCNGLPLAAKTLGSLMRNKKNNIREWRDVVKSKTWELKEVQQDVFRPLLLSYHDLPLPTKQCLLYCVLFPKDHVYDKNGLVELWMSQDYLNDNGSKEKMIVGQNYFDDLVTRSFFQDIEKVGEENVNVTLRLHLECLGAVKRMGWYYGWTVGAYVVPIKERVMTSCRVAMTLTQIKERGGSSKPQVYICTPQEVAQHQFAFQILTQKLVRGDMTYEEPWSSSFKTVPSAREIKTSGSGIPSISDEKSSDLAGKKLAVNFACLFSQLWTQGYWCSRV
ncbi:hypothetical protein ACLB2K_071529 [Fragaria x ananassa]